MQMKTLAELKKDLLADGIIDAAEVAQLKEVLYADGIIDKEEADFLFELNDAVSGAANAPEWKTFFTQAICDFLLKDEVSPGEIDADEEAWLIDKVNNDGQVDETEKELLRELKRQAKSFPENLDKLL
jgi:uncharacterized membrane protein YebE (DUF533 family)